VGFKKKMQLGDDLTPEEEAMYLGGGYYKPQQQQQKNDYIDQYEKKETPKYKRKASYMLSTSENNDNDGGDDDDQDYFDIENMQYASVSKNVTADDKELEDNPIMKHYEFKVPINRMGAGRIIISRHIQNAASTLIDASTIQGGSAIVLDSATRSTLQRLTNHVDEYATIDPPVVISCSLSISDSFKAFLEEVISFSEYILLHVLDAGFRVVVTNSTKTQRIPFNDPDLGLQLNPYIGDDETRGQPFNVRHCIEEVAGRISQDKWVQIEAHMLSLGKISPVTVCDVQFVQDQIQVFKNIISGQTIIVRKRQKKDGRK